jgi:hypothetical protein
VSSPSPWPPPGATLPPWPPPQANQPAPPQPWPRVIITILVKEHRRRERWGQSLSISLGHSTLRLARQAVAAVLLHARDARLSWCWVATPTFSSCIYRNLFHGTQNEGTRILNKYWLPSLLWSSSPWWDSAINVDMILDRWFVNRTPHQKDL